MLLLLTACTGSPIGDSSETGNPTDTDTTVVTPGLAGLDDLGARNLIILHVDTLRADRLTPYGGIHDTLPLTDARDWLVVNDYYSVSSWTIPATASLVTGREIESHGLTRVDSAHEPNAAITDRTLAEHLQDAGFVTFAASGNAVVQTVEGMANGFDAVNVLGEIPASRLDDLRETSFEWLDEQDPSAPFFILMQPMDTHGAYHPDSKAGIFSDLETLPISTDVRTTEEEQVAQFEAAYRAATTDEERAAIVANLQALYDELILNIDDATEALFEDLEERGLRDDTLVVLTADHGETVGDDLEFPSFGHGGTVRPELTHIPLMFSHPRLADQDIECLSQNIDLAPTLAQALGLGAIEGVDGLPLQDGCRSSVHASTYFNNTDRNAAVELMVSDGASMLRWLCGLGGSRRYDLTTDPTGQRALMAEDLPNNDTLEAEVEVFYQRLVEGLGIEHCRAM